MKNMYSLSALMLGKVGQLKTNSNSDSNWRWCTLQQLPDTPFCSRKDQIEGYSSWHYINLNSRSYLSICCIYSLWEDSINPCGFTLEFDQLLRWESVAFSCNLLQNEIEGKHIFTLNLNFDLLISSIGITYAFCGNYETHYSYARRLSSLLHYPRTASQPN